MMMMTSLVLLPVVVTAATITGINAFAFVCPLRNAQSFGRSYESSIYWTTTGILQRRRQSSSSSSSSSSSVLRLRWSSLKARSASASASSSSTSSVKSVLKPTKITAVTQGSRGGAALLLDDLSVWQGPNRILSNLHWNIEPRSKWALVGSNGAGKSTLLNAILRSSSESSGHEIRSVGVVVDGICCVGGSGNVGYLPQTALAASTSFASDSDDDNHNMNIMDTHKNKNWERRSVYDVVAAAMTQVQAARRNMNTIVAAMTQQSQSKNDDDDDLHNALEMATTRFAALGGYQQEAKISTVLKGLGFNNNNQNLKQNNYDYKMTRCDELSGGWQMRVALARLLLSDAPVLILMDEPSNHLDAAAKEWLTRYLKNYDGSAAMILVTHDRSLLETMDHIAEIVPYGKQQEDEQGGSLHIYKSCTYDQYEALKQERARTAQAQYQQNLSKARKLQAFVDRFGASANKASAAQSRVKQLDRMKQQGLLIEPNDIAGGAVAGAAMRFKPTLRLSEPPRVSGGEILLRLVEASIGYHNETIVLSNVHLEITKGMKLLIRGPNGAGKSTILHALRGTLPLLNGTLFHHEELRLGMFTQDLAQELDANARAVDVVTEYARTGRHGNVLISNEQARTVLGRLGLAGEKSVRLIRDLSGGEKARVCLAMFALKPSNLYLLDEVSNHLDRECVECLSDALSSWGGTIGALVVVSHDRHFCQQLDFTHVATVQDGRLRLEARNAVQSDWVVHSLSQGTTPTNSQSAAVAATAPTYTNDSETTDLVDPKLRKQAFNAPKRIAKLEVLISSLEEQMAVIDNQMIAAGSDADEVMELSRERNKLESSVSTCMDEWEELDKLLAFVASTTGR